MMKLTHASSMMQLFKMFRWTRRILCRMIWISN